MASQSEFTELLFHVLFHFFYIIARPQTSPTANVILSIPQREKKEKYTLLMWHGHHAPDRRTQMVKNPPAAQEIWVQSLGLEDLLEKEMATHSSILGWRIPQTEEHGGL